MKQLLRKFLEKHAYRYATSDLAPGEEKALSLLASRQRQTITLLCSQYGYARLDAIDMCIVMTGHFHTMAQIDAEFVRKIELQMHDYRIYLAQEQNHSKHQ